MSKSLLLICFALSLCAGCEHKSLPKNTLHPLKKSMPRVECAAQYATILEKLLYYKKGRFSVFYGGPITSSGAQWLMLATFEDEEYHTRACYEIAFVNCSLEDAEGANVYFHDASEIDLKFKNELNPDFQTFSRLIAGQYPGKYILVRASDVAMPFYPNICLASLSSSSKQDTDRETIAQFLSDHFKTKSEGVQLESSASNEEIEFQNELEISYQPIQVHITIDGKQETFYLMKKILLQDPWKIYYIVTCNPALFLPSFTHSLANLYFVRLDSGCTSGQIYNDNSCDCLDQLHQSLSQLAKHYRDNGVVIHIPTHDGRGFGSTLKAETEIYKQGGRGRVYKTEPLDTIAAAQQLYQSEAIDLRTFDGAAYILKQLNVREIALFTDNRFKAESLAYHDLKIVRIATNTSKESCIEHLKSKKQNSTYYSD